MTTNNTDTTVDTVSVSTLKADKKKYSRPTLAVLGSVKQLTQTGSATMSDASTMMQ
ncbi:MAG: hypothetical protein V4603_16480 [Pseudomonadota bacterium]